MATPTGSSLGVDRWTAILNRGFVCVVALLLVSSGAVAGAQIGAGQTESADPAADVQTVSEGRAEAASDQQPQTIAATEPTTVETTTTDSGDSENTTGQDTAPEPGDELWNISVKRTVRGGPTVADGLVFAGDRDGHLIAADAKTGETKWNVTVGNMIVDSSPTVAEGTVYIGTTGAADSLFGTSDDGNVSALDAETGEMQWQFETTGVVGSPTYADGTIYIGTVKGTLYALDAEAGTVLWQKDVDSRVYSSPTVADGRVYFGTAADKVLGSTAVYALDADTGRTIWKHTERADFDASPTVANGTVYIPDSGETLYAFDADTGQVQWTNTSNYADSSPTVADGTVYQKTKDNRLYAFDADTGTKQWSYDEWAYRNTKSSPTVANDTVYFGFEDGLGAVDADTGKKKWFYSTQEGVFNVSAGSVGSPPTVADGIVYFGSYDWRLYAVATNHSQSSSGSRVQLGTLGHVGDRAADPNRPPTVDLQRETVCAGVGDPIRFDASGSNDPDGEITQYEWRVDGENVNAGGPTLDWQFDSAGEYPVTLTVQDDEGLDDSTTQTVSVPAPDEDGIGVTPGEIIANDTASFSFCGESNETIRWEFGDGSTATGENVTHTYTSAGNYTVTASTDAETLVTRTIDVRTDAIEITGIEAEKRITPIARYPVNETYGVGVATRGTDIAYVEFSMPSGETTRDDTPGDGYTRTVDFENVTGPTYLTVTAVGTNGTTVTRQRFIPVYSAPPLQTFLEACESVKPDKACSGGVVEYKNSINLTAINKLNNIVGQRRGININSGAKFDALNLKLEANGGFTLVNPLPESVLNKLPASIDFEASGQVAGGARFVPERNYTFDAREEPLKFKIESKASGSAPIPSPISAGGLAGVQVVVDVSGGLGVQGKLRNKTLSGPLDPTAKKVYLTGTGAAMPEISAAVCEARAGPELGVSAGYRTSDQQVYGESKLSFRAEFECLFAAQTKKVVIVKETYPSGPNSVPSRTVTRNSSSWEPVSKHGVGPETGAADAGGPQLAPTDTRTKSDRLTTDTVADQSPSMTGRNGTYTAVWSRQDPAKNVTDGRDIFVATADDSSWSEPQHLTDDRKVDIRPDVTTTPDGRIAVWARINDSYTRKEIQALDDPTAVLDELEIAVATASDDSWSDPTLLTNNSVLDTEPTVVTSGDRALVTWTRDTDGDIETTDDRQTAYALYDDGTLTDIRMLNTTAVATSGAPGGDLRVAYANGTTVVTGRVAADGTLTTTDRYSGAAPDANVTSIAAGPNRTAWFTGGAGNRTLSVANATGVTTLATQPNVTGLTELSLAQRNGVTLVTYRGRTPGTNGSTLYYRLERNGTWNTDRGFASGVTRNRTVWDSSTALTDTGFKSVYLSQPALGFNSSQTPRADLFATGHTYKPDYSITANAGRAAPGEQTTINYTLTNSGDVPTSTSGTVEVVNASGVVANATHSTLDVGESVTGQLTGIADATGSVTVRVDSANRTSELDETNNDATVTTGQADLRIDGVSQTRDNDTVVVSVAVANNGNATATETPVTLGQNGTQLALTNVTIGPNATQSATVTAPIRELTGTPVTLRVRSGTTDGTSRRMRLAQPDLGLQRDTVRYYDTDDAIRAEIVVGNRGVGGVNTTLEARNGTELIGSTDIHIPGTASNATTFRTVSLSLPASAAGTTITIRADSERLDANPADNGVRMAVEPVLTAPNITLVRTETPTAQATMGRFSGVVQDTDRRSAIESGFRYWVAGEKNKTTWVNATTNASTGTFEAAVDGLAPNTSYVVQATGYTDRLGWQNASTASFETGTRTNRPPVAVAGGPYSVAENGTVRLDLSESHDPDGAIVETVWTVTSGPGQISNGTYRAPDTISSNISVNATLTVTDASGQNASDTATISVIPSSNSSDSGSSNDGGSGDGGGATGPTDGDGGPTGGGGGATGPTDGEQSTSTENDTKTNTTDRIEATPTTRTRATLPSDDESATVTFDNTSTVRYVDFGRENVTGAVAVAEYTEPPSAVSNRTDDIRTAVDGGSDVTDVTVLSVADIRPTNDTAVESAATVRFTVNATDVADSDSVAIVHRRDNGTWEALETTSRDAVERGRTVTGNVDPFSLFAVVSVESTRTTPPASTDTPERSRTAADGTATNPSTTGGDGAGFGVLVALVSALAMGLLATRRSS